MSKKETAEKAHTLLFTSVKLALFYSASEHSHDILPALIGAYGSNTQMNALRIFLERLCDSSQQKHSAGTGFAFN